MGIEIRPCRSVEEVRDALNGIGHYFGDDNDLESTGRFTQRLEIERMHAAWDGDRIVGGAGTLTFRMSVPGGSIPCGGLTVVGVLPTHRRRGVLTGLMREQLADCRARGEPAAYLWASESTIYPRFGYGLAALTGEMRLARERTAFAQPFETCGTVRLVDVEEASRTFPPLYEQMFAQRPGLFSRTTAWWEGRRLVPSPYAPKTPKRLALLELDGEPAGYAIYTVNQDWAHGSSAGNVTVVEAVAPTPEATRELWRWLLDFDWTSEFHAGVLPLDHPLFLLLAEPRRMRFEVGDGIWLRLIDVEAALAARSYEGDTQVVVELTDAFLPENAGRWRLGARGAERTNAAAELELDITGLGSVYLGGFSFADLVRSLRATELVNGAVERADALFRTSVQPWCAEIF
ncbi:MAG TPA: GNAT family N-acetyltransferase [Gaiellaceae bacterium]|nr:GNAT family N-acetyltransferase [Gaiellaceae bacterium]